MLKTSNYKTYLVKYFHDEAWWQIEITATSFDDAQARIKKLALAQPLGELVMKLPASAGVFARCYCWLRNALGQK
jgi:hypothetical protein